MLVPTINLNGTPGAELLKQYTDAMDAIVVALVAMRAIECHGRDFPDLPRVSRHQRAQTAQRMKGVEVRRLEDLHLRITHVATELQNQLLAREQTRATS